MQKTGTFSTNTNCLKLCRKITLFKFILKSFATHARIIRDKWDSMHYALQKKDLC